MKKLFTPLFVLAAAFFFIPQAAEARSHKHHSSHRYVSGHTSCGCSIYTKRVVRSYDCHGHPIYAYYRQPVKHRCHARRHHGSSHVRVTRDYGHNYGHRYSRRGYGNSCGTRSGVSFSYGSRW